MGLFLKKRAEKSIIWEKLSSTAELHEALKQSNQRAKVFFKHSTRCGTSIMALNSFENAWDDSVEADLYYIDVLRQRSVSDELAALSNVIHESPQAIVLKDDLVIYHASHGAIDNGKIETLLK